MNRLLRTKFVWSCGVTALVVTAVGYCPAQEPKSRAGAVSRKGSVSPGRASGVITKVELVQRPSVSDSKTGGRARQDRQARRHLRLTINTAAVWRDWARDQAMESVSQPARREAAEGANSVATRGQPQSNDTLVVIDIAPETQIETRFRALSDESSKGARTPEEVVKGDKDLAVGQDRPRSRDSRTPARGPRTQAAKPTRFTVDDLRPGLFVEVDFQHRNDLTQDRASSVAVIRAVGGAARPARPTEK
jgi:hypothetical protein